MQAQKTASMHKRLERYNELSGFIEEDNEKKKRLNKPMKENISLDCGWGNLLFGQTFADHEALIKQFSRERTSCRDIAIYTPNHHVLLSLAPELLFVDPSDTYRLWLSLYRPPARRSRAFTVRMLQNRNDAREINKIYSRCGMIEAPEDTILKNQFTRVFCYYLAERTSDGKVIGVVSGIDHKEAFNDPTNGSSLWCLCVDPDARASGVGRTLVREVAEHFIARGREYLDLSVMHDNKKAKNLYRSLGFRKIPVFAVKKKNTFNRKLYLGGPKK
ncbi:MAG: GNAT family N-acetyltransferase [Bacillota bacterium]|nr:GNAT family N-acetyltransferase [Bacillota bacterium]